MADPVKTFCEFSATTEKEADIYVRFLVHDGKISAMYRIRSIDKGRIRTGRTGWRERFQDAVRDVASLPGIKNNHQLSCRLWKEADDKIQIKMEFL